MGQPHDLTQGDFNFDGRLDLAIANDLGGSVSVMLGQASGGFSGSTTYATGTRTLSIATADFNRDGVLDLVAANYSDDNVSVLLGNGDGTFVAARQFDAGPGSGPHYVAVADFDGDGQLDLGLANFDSGQLSILRGNGDGSFSLSGTYDSGVAPVIIVSDDWNGDQKIDLAIVNGGGDSVSVFFGQGDGTFESRLVLPVQRNPYAMTSGDLNQDGRRDLIVANRVDSSVSVLIGNGDGTFRAPQNYYAGSGATSIAIGDFDDDGNDDLIVATLWTSNLFLLRGNDDGTLQPAEMIEVAGAQRSVIAGDFNGDGRPDLATSIYYDDLVSILYNVLPPDPDLVVGAVTGENIFVLQNANVSSATASVALSNGTASNGTINGFSTTLPYLLTATTGQTFSGAGMVTPASVVSLLSTAVNTTALGATVTYTTAAADLNSANNTATVNVRVGNAPLALFNTSVNFGAALNAATPPRNSYTNLSSNTSGGDQVASTGSPVKLDTTASILNYNNAAVGDIGTVSMAWRTRTTLEASNMETLQGGGLNTNQEPSGYLISNVVRVAGLDNRNDITLDTFVLQMNYDEALLFGNEATLATNRNIFLGWNDNGTWVNAITGNVGWSESFVNRAYQPGDEFASGRWGIDTANNTVWAVLNHEGDFAVWTADPAAAPPTNNRPTTSGILNQTISSRIGQSGNYGDIPLWPAFADVEDADSQLTYSIERETRPGYFNYVIDPATGFLRATIATTSWNITNVTVRATDRAGAFVETTFQLSVFADDNFPAQPAPTVTGPADLGSFLRNALTDLLAYNITITNNTSFQTTYYALQSGIEPYYVSSSPLNILAGGQATTVMNLKPTATATNGRVAGRLGYYGDGGTDIGYHNFSYNVGNATLTDYPDYGPKLTANTPISNTEYRNLASNTLDTSLHQGASLGRAVGTTATILSYTNLTGSDDTVTMSWQARRTGPMLRWGSSPSTPSTTTVNLVSDTVLVEGLYNSLGSYRDTDPFVIQMSYDEALLNDLESTYVATGQLSLVSFNEYLYDSPEQYYGWGKTIEGNSSGSETYHQSSWAAAGSPLTVGSWGVDATNNVVWAVVNHGAEFGVATLTNSVTPPANTPPTVVAPPQSIMTTVGGPTSTTELVPIFTDAEDGAGGLIYSVPSNTSSAVVTFDNANKELRLNFDSATPGTGDITIRATDSQGLSVETTLQVTVNAVLEARLDFPNRTSTVLEDAALTTIVGALHDYSAGPLPTTNVTTDRPDLFAVQPSIVYDISNVPSLRFQPAADQFGTATVTLTQQHDATPQVFTITITPVNDAPSFVAGPNVLVAESSGEFTSNWIQSSSPGPSNEAAQELSYLVQTDRPELFAVQPAISGSGQLTFTPVPGAVGMANISVLARDNGGTANGGIDESAVLTFTISIVPTQPLPGFAPGADVTVLEDTGNYAAAWGSDSGYSTPATSFVLTVNNSALFDELPTLERGSNLTDPWILEFTPAANAYGSTLVRVQEQSAGNDVGIVHEFFVSIDPVNDSPSFIAGSHVLVEQDSGAHNSTWVISAATGPANEATQVLSYRVVTDRPELFAVLPALSASGQLTFTPAPGAAGVANITVQALDNGGTANGGVAESPPQFSTITIQPTSPAVVEVSVLEDSGAYRQLLSFPGGAFVYSAEISFTIVSGDPNLFASQPRLVSENYQEWHLEFTPQANAAGLALVNIVADSSNGQLKHDFYLEVKPVNDAPSFTSGDDLTVRASSGAYNQRWATEISAGPANERSQQLSWSVSAENPALFAVQPTLGPDGRLSFTPSSNAAGTTRVLVTLRDNGGTDFGASDTFQTSLTITITIEPQRDAGPTIKSIEFWSSTGPLAAPFLAPISAIVVTFDREMSITGAGDVRAKHHWQLTKDGYSLSEKIAATKIISRPGEPTQLRISFTEPLGTGSYLLVAAPTLTDAQGITFQSGESRNIGAEYPIPFRVSLVDTTIVPPEPVITDPPPLPGPVGILELPKVSIDVAVAPASAPNRIQAAGDIQPPEKVPELPIAPEPLPPFISNILRMDYTTAVALQPELAISGFGTTFITSTIPDFALGEEGDEFISRTQSIEQLGYVQRPVASSPATETPYSWWWVGLGLSSLLGGLGYYALQRRYTRRAESLLPNNSSDLPPAAARSPFAPE